MADTLDWDALNLIDQINQDDDLTAEYINPLKLLNINNNYHDTDQITKEFNKNQLNIIHLNIHSLADKFDKLKLFLSNFTNKPDIILLCETFLNDKNKDLYNMDDYSFIEKHRTINIHPTRSSRWCFNRRNVSRRYKRILWNGLAIDPNFSK